MSESDRDPEFADSDSDDESESSAPSSGCFLEIPGDALGECDDSAGLLALLADEAAAAE